MNDAAAPLIGRDKLGTNQSAVVFSRRRIPERAVQRACAADSQVIEAREGGKARGGTAHTAPARVRL